MKQNPAVLEIKEGTALESRARVYKEGQFGVNGRVAGKQGQRALDISSGGSETRREPLRGKLPALTGVQTALTGAQTALTGAQTALMGAESCLGLSLTE